MDVDRPHREFSRLKHDGAGRGPAGHQNLLLHHPVPQQQLLTEELRSSTHGPAPSEYFTGRLRISSASASPVPRVRLRSPVFPPYPPGRQPIRPTQPSASAPRRSPTSYHSGSRWRSYVCLPMAQHPWRISIVLSCSILRHSLYCCHAHTKRKNLLQFIQIKSVREFYLVP